MTISYAGNFARLLLRWKGSIWKSVWKELLLFLILYYFLRLAYNQFMDEHQRQTFEYVALMFEEYTKNIPLTFLLGFYISAIVKRWWSQFEWVAWPDDLLSVVCMVIPGDDADSRLKRHAIARYLNLTAALAWRDISIKVRKRFPSIEHFVKVGLMTEGELALFNAIQVEPVHWFLPLQWTQKIVQKIHVEGKIAAPLNSIFLNELKNYRVSFRKLYCYDWVGDANFVIDMVCIPLVYTQVAALGNMEARFSAAPLYIYFFPTYGYFGFCLLGRQFLDTRKKILHYEVDFVVPIFTIVQFLFFIGWFKVGQDLMRPFGTDDDDIELNYIIDRNIQTSFAMVDSVFDQDPSLGADKFWPKEDSNDNGTGSLIASVPHTKMSARLKEHPPKLHSYIRLRSPSDKDISEEQQPPTPSNNDLETSTKRTTLFGVKKPAISW